MDSFFSLAERMNGIMHFHANDWKFFLLRSPPQKRETLNDKFRHEIMALGNLICVHHPVPWWGMKQAQLATPSFRAWEETLSWPLIVSQTRLVFRFFSLLAMTSPSCMTYHLRISFRCRQHFFGMVEDLDRRKKCWWGHFLLKAHRWHAETFPQCDEDGSRKPSVPEKMLETLLLSVMKNDWEIHQLSNLGWHRLWGWRRCSLMRCSWRANEMSSVNKGSMSLSVP